MHLCCLSKILSTNDINPAAAHFGNRPGDVVRLQVYATAAVFDQVGLEAFGGRVQGGELHAVVGGQAQRRLKGKVRYEPVGFELLPPKFTLTQLQRLYETILERPLDKRNFRKKVLKLAEETGILVELDEVQQDVAHRAARLWRFDEEKYRRMKRKGIHFEI